MRWVSVGAWGLVALSAGCVTPMASREVDGLTHCRGSDLKRIRKSLLLAGYEIKNGGDDDLVTEYKQIAGYGGDRTLRRVTVVKVGDGEYRFKVRLKSVRLERPGQNDAATMHGASSASTSQDKQARIVIDMNPPVELEDEYDEEYYEERRARYEEVQREVCGG